MNEDNKHHLRNYPHKHLVPSIYTTEVESILDQAKEISDKAQEIETCLKDMIKSEERSKKKRVVDLIDKKNRKKKRKKAKKGLYEIQKPYIIGTKTKKKKKTRKGGTGNSKVDRIMNPYRIKGDENPFDTTCVYDEDQGYYSKKITTT